MIDNILRKRLFDEAFALIARAEALLDDARARHQEKVAESCEEKRAA